mgnify:CR=1 FL=1
MSRYIAWSACFGFCITVAFFPRYVESCLAVLQWMAAMHLSVLQKQIAMFIETFWCVFSARTIRICIWHRCPLSVTHLLIWHFRSVPWRVQINTDYRSNYHRHFSALDHQSDINKIRVWIEKERNGKTTPVWGRFSVLHVVLMELLLKMMEMWLSGCFSCCFQHSRSFS